MDTWATIVSPLGSVLSWGPVLNVVQPYHSRSSSSSLLNRQPFDPPKGIFCTGREHVRFRCRRLCERVFTALWAKFPSTLPCNKSLEMLLCLEMCSCLSCLYSLQDWNLVGGLSCHQWSPTHLVICLVLSVWNTQDSPKPLEFTIGQR